MASKIFPDELEQFGPGEQRTFFMDFVDELDGDTAGSGTVEVLDDNGKDVTQEIAPPSGEFGAWTVSGTTFTVTFRIPKERFHQSYLVTYTMQSSTSNEKFKKYLGILVSAPAGVF